MHKYIADNGLISKIYKEIIKLNSKSTNNPIYKMGKGPNQAFFPKKVYKWPIGTQNDAQHH